MSRPASSPKTAVIAGTLAGLLAAALGAYYLHMHRAAANAIVPGSPPVPQAPAGAMRTRGQASMALMALPELKAWSASIEKNSGGKVHGALIEYDPAPRIVNGKTYWQFSFVENGADAVHRWENFLVSSIDDDILVEDLALDKLLSLERWRKEKHPMERTSAR